LYQFDAANDQELSFKTGDILTILSQNGDWWQAGLNGKFGLIPGNYVEIVR